MNIKEILKKEANSKYKKFSSGLIPNKTNILGVRLPFLRKLAAEIKKNKGSSFLYEEAKFFEETMLKGMLIGLLDCNLEEILFHTKNFIPKIDNWSVCDSFCTGLKITNKNKDIFWNFIKKYTKGNEFEKRFFLVMALSYYVEKNYIDEIFKIINKMNLDEYYSRMGAAWLISVCYVKFPKKTKEFLSKNNLDYKTQNKSIQKIIESLRVSDLDKKEIRKFKKTIS